MPRTFIGGLTKLALTLIGAVVVTYVMVWSFFQTYTFIKAVSNEDINFVLAVGIQFLPNVCWIVAHKEQEHPGVRDIFNLVGWVFSAIDGGTNIGQYWMNREVGITAPIVLGQVLMSVICLGAVLAEEALAFVLSAFGDSINDLVELRYGKPRRIKALEWGDNMMNATPIFQKKSDHQVIKDSSYAQTFAHFSKLSRLNRPEALKALGKLKNKELAARLRRELKLF
jgi:hypothetical protein